MLFHLLKKDVLIAKKYIIAAITIVIIMPAYILFNIPDFHSFVPFLYMIIIGEMFTIQTISQEESKYPKAITLLCATPYSRRAFIQAKYLFYPIMFLYCLLVFIVIGKIFFGTLLINLTSILISLFLSVLLFAIYMPIDIKYGSVKSRFIYMIAIFVLSFAPGLVLGIFKKTDFNINFVNSIPIGVVNVILFFLSVAVFFISMSISNKIFCEKEL